MNRFHYLLLLSLLLALAASFASGASKEEEEKERERQKRLYLFQIVTFPNAPCIGSSGTGKNGTCYTAKECVARAGVNSGNCAEGYGVCCVFSANCGSTFSENCTYFESTGVNEGSCSVEICKCSTNICQLRLDFDMFQITGPSTATETVGMAVNGVVGTAGPMITASSQCLTDTFSVSNPGGPSPPVICGMNTGEHMYIDTCEDCIDLTFAISNNNMGTGAAANRQWSIKVTQYSCDFNNLAPPGCTQYFFGSNTNTVRTFNYQGGQHLANQKQTICIRRERNYCRICWTAAEDTDFAVSGDAAANNNKGESCCGYGSDGMMSGGYDCVQIPGALTMSSKRGPEEICGRSMGLATATNVGPKTVCSDRCPFEISFLSDGFEFAPEVATIMTNAGFELVYTQTSNCNMP